MIAEKVLANGLTYKGFDTDRNGTVWLERKGHYTYICYQPDEFTVRTVCITKIDKDNWQAMMRYHSIPASHLARIRNGEAVFTFWYGTEYWVFTESDAISKIKELWSDISEKEIG